jgi:hypothetical protein
MLFQFFQRSVSRRDKKTENDGANFCGSTHIDFISVIGLCRLVAIITTSDSSI